MGGSGREGQQCCPPCSPPALYFGHAGRHRGGGGACRSAGQQRGAGKNCPPAPCPPLCLSLSRRAGALLCIPLPSSSQPCRFDPAPPHPEWQRTGPPHCCLPEELGGLFAAEGPSLAEHIVPSPSATLQTPVSLPQAGSVLLTLPCIFPFPTPPCVSPFAGRAWPEGHGRGQGGQGGARHAWREGMGLGRLVQGQGVLSWGPDHRGTWTW